MEQGLKDSGYDDLLYLARGFSHARRERMYEVLDETIHALAVVSSGPVHGSVYGACSCSVCQRIAERYVTRAERRARRAP